jgi:hypothetical protein
VPDQRYPEHAIRRRRGQALDAPRMLPHSGHTAHPADGAPFGAAFQGTSGRPAAATPTDDATN